MRHPTFRSPRGRLAHALYAAGALVAIESAIWLAQALWHVVPLLLITGAGLVGYRLARRRGVRMPRCRRDTVQATVTVPPDLATECARLRDELDQARADLNDAHMSAEVAWQAAEAVAPRQARVLRDDMRDPYLRGDR